MKVSSVLLVAVVMMSLMVSSYPLTTPTTTPTPTPTPIKASPPLQTPPRVVEVPGFCVPKCAHRCSRNPRDLCKKLCISCCTKCKCVPTGPFGDKKECPCYRDWYNKAGKPKCP